MKGLRELNNMKDTPSFKIKKVLALSKLRHSNITGRKAAPGTSSKASKKHLTVKVKSDVEDKGTSTELTIAKRRGRPVKAKVKEKETSITSAANGEQKKGFEQKVPVRKDEQSAEKKVLKEETVTDQSSSSDKRKKFEKKHSKSKISSKPERNLRSQIGEMLMRHGKKVTKAPMPKRKRTLSADFELLDERSLKRTLKETAETASGNETDQNDSDASVVPSHSESKLSRSVRKKQTSSKTPGKESVLDSSWVDCPSPLVDPSNRVKKKSKNTVNSRDSSLDGSEAGIIMKRQVAKQKTSRKQTDAKYTAEEDIQADLPGKEQDQKSQSDEKQVIIPRKRGRPPKRKRFHSNKDLTKEQSTVSENTVKASEVQQKQDISKSGTKDMSKDISDTILSDGRAVVKKQRLSQDESTDDPYSFCVVDFDEEYVDSEISFKPTGISGEVKRKPGRPKHGAARQPAVKALKVKSTHKLLISDQKARPFSRVRGGRILKASQIYRGSGHKRRQPLQSKTSSLICELKKGLVETTDVPDSVGCQTKLAEKVLPVIAPLNIVIADQDVGAESPLSPDIQHPDLTIIKDLISPAPSNEDLEPPVLEPANIDPCVVHAREKDDESAKDTVKDIDPYTAKDTVQDIDPYTAKDIDSTQFDNEQMFHDEKQFNVPETTVDKIGFVDIEIEHSVKEVSEIQETELINREIEVESVVNERSVKSVRESETLTEVENGKEEDFPTELVTEIVIETESEITVETSLLGTICETHEGNTVIDTEEIANDVKMYTDHEAVAEADGGMLVAEADGGMLDSIAKELKVDVQNEMSEGREGESDIKDLSTVPSLSEPDGKGTDQGVEQPGVDDHDTESKVTELEMKEQMSVGQDAELEVKQLMSDGLDKELEVKNPVPVGQDAESEVKQPMSYVPNTQSDETLAVLDVQDIECELKQTISDVQDTPSDVTQPVLDVQGSESEVKEPLSDVQDTLSDVTQPELDIQDTEPEVKHSVSDVQHPVSDVKHTESEVHHSVTEPQETEAQVEQPESVEKDTDSEVEVEKNLEETDLKVEDVVETVVENCLKTLVDTVADMMHSITCITDNTNKIDVSVSDELMDDSDVKDRDLRYDCGIKMKLKRHKGKFKVTRLSEEDESILGDAEEVSDPEMDADVGNEKKLSKQDDVTLVMNSILDEIENLLCNSVAANGDSPSIHSEHNKSSESEVFADTTDMESVNSSSCSDISPTDSEKRVPPLTIRLKSGKAGKKPVRKFELRPKFSRSPIEIIAMRQKRYEEEYDKNEATRLAKKLEKQIGKRKNLMKTAFKEANWAETVNVAETGLSNAEKAGNIHELLDLCTPCSVSVVDFVKQLNLQPDDEEVQKSSSAGELDIARDVHSESQPASVSDIQKKGAKSGKKSQFKSGRPRGRPPKLKNKLPTATKVTTKTIIDEPPQQEITSVERDMVEELKEVGFVGSFVEFLKSKKKEKTKTGKHQDGSKGTKKSEEKIEPSKTTTTMMASPTAATTTAVTSMTETVKTKHVSGDRKSGVRYVCNKCEFSSAVQKTMVFHVYSHIPGVSFKCGYCNKDFLSMAGASAHSKNEHPGKESRIIKSKDLNESELYHIVEEVPKIDATNLKPSEAGQVSGSAGPGQMIISFLVGSNLALKASTKRFVCTHCDYSTDILEDVQQHSTDLHATDNMYACILCADAYFSSEESVKNHNHSTHPTRPQSYRKLPSFYDIEQMKAAEKSQLEDRGNIFDRMNNLFSTSAIADEAGGDNQRKAHYQRARDFLYVQEGWKNKTSAEADSTTILENESVGLTDGQVSESVASIGDCALVQEKTPVSTAEQSSTSPDKESGTKSMDMESSQDQDKVCGTVNSEKLKEKPNEISTPLPPDKQKKADDIFDGSKPEKKGPPEVDTKTSINSEGPVLPAPKVVCPPDVASISVASGKTGTHLAKGMSQQAMSAESGISESEDATHSKTDDSGVSNLKIIDVVSLRDQNPDQSQEATKKKILPKPASHLSRGSSNLPEVDVDALVLRNERITCTYKCMKCNIHSPYLSAMVEHLKHYHSEVTLFTCPYCRGLNSQKPEFATEVNVHEHVKKVHPSNCAKNEVSLSDTAKTFVQVLAIPSGVECNKVGNTFVIEKDIYMCLKCQAHMPSLDYTFGHLEREHPDAFVQVCPLCKTFKDKSEEVVFGHIMKEHKQDPNDHPLSVAIEDNLFVRIPSISKSGAYNDRVNPSKGVKADTNRKSYSKSPVRSSRHDDSEDDVLVVGETKNLSRPSAIRSAGTLIRRGRPPLISQGVGSITTAANVSHKVPVKTNTIQQLQSRALTGITSKLSAPKHKVSNFMKPNSEQSQELMMDCENIDDPVNALADIVEDDGDVEIPAVTSTPSCSVGSIIDSSNVISHSAAVAVASSVVSVATTAQMTTTVPSVTQSSTTSAVISKQSVKTSFQPSPMRNFGVSISKPDVVQTANVTEAKAQNTAISQQTSLFAPEKRALSEKAKEIQITRPKSSLFSMTDKLHRLHVKAAEREREKERAAQGRSSPSSGRGNPQSTRDSTFGARSSPLTNRNSPMISSSQPVSTGSRPVLKVPTYTSIPRHPQRPVSATPPSVTSVNHNVQQNQSLAAQVQRKSLLFRNCPLDLSRTPSPATTIVSSNAQLKNTTVTTTTQSRTVSDELPPDAFKIFNLKPDSRRQKSSPSTSSSVPATPPVTQILGNTIPNIVGTLAAPGTLLQQVQALPYTQLAQMQMAGVPLNPLQLQGLCIPAPNSSFVLANIPQQPGPRPNISPQQIPQMHIRPGNTASGPSVPVSQAARLSTAKTVAQALAERSQSARPALPQPRAPSKQHIPLLPMNKANARRMTHQTFYCPYCSQFRHLQEYEVKPHIERCHPGKEVLFFKLS